MRPETETQDKMLQTRPKTTPKVTLDPDADADDVIRLKECQVKHETYNTQLGIKK